MATYKSDQFVADGETGRRLRPFDEHGKMRADYAYFKNLTGAALAAGDTVNLFRLPPGAVRLTPYLSKLRNTALASGTLSIGLRSYSKAENEDPVPENATELLNARAMTAAGSEPLSETIKYDLYSKRGIVVFATIGGAGLPANGELEILLPYLYE